MFLKEVQSIETVDGKKLFFTGEYYLRAFANFGMAPVRYITQAGYRQIGETVRDFTLETRSIPISIYTTQNMERSEYWRERARILDIFRPNRGAARLNQLKLTLRREDDSKRFIYCFYESGLEFQDDNEQENAFRIQTTVNLFCPNPIFYDSGAISISPSADVASELVFPITFPIIFGSSGAVYNTGNLNYEGTWRAYPVITIDGPYTTATLTLQPFNIGILLANSIGIGEQRIISLSESNFSIVDENGLDKFSDVQTANLVDFNIRPSDQLSAGETQSIEVNLLNGVDGTSAVTIDYNTAYIGI